MTSSISLSPIALRIWAAAQLAPDESVVDGTDRIARILAANPLRLKGRSSEETVDVIGLAHKVWNAAMMAPRDLFYDCVTRVGEVLEANGFLTATIHPDVVTRYYAMVSKLDHRNPECIPVPGTDWPHLKWMLIELLHGKIEDDKAHRWLAFVQGILMARCITTVETERNFTRPYFTQASGPLIS